MTSFPSNRVMIITLLALMGWFGFKFARTAQEHFFQLAFDWNKMKILDPTLDINLDSISYNFLKVQTQQKYIPSPNSTYYLQVAEKEYFFRYEYALQEQNAISFRGLEWVINIPQNVKSEGKLTEVVIDLKQNAGKSIITIGDEILFRNEAKYFRKRLAQLINLEFKGNQRDVFNYPYETIENNTSKNLFSRIDEMDFADNYVLFFGPNDEATSLEEIKENIESILTLLKTEKKAKKIILVLLPPSTYKKENEYAKDYNTILLEISRDDGIVEKVDSYSLFENNLQKYLREDGILISKQGYEKLAKAVSYILNDE